MSFHLDLFGSEISRIRKALNLTQKRASFLSGVHEDTLRKIEHGKVVPTHTTLNLLSVLYCKDINSIFLSYRLEDYSSFLKITASIERKKESDNYNDLNEDIASLKNLASNCGNNFFKRKIVQFILFTEGVLLKSSKDYKNALSKYSDALSLTLNGFSLDNFKNRFYSEMELQLLMGIGLLKWRTNNKRNCLEILLFCEHFIKTNSLYFNSRLYSKLCFNISYTFHRLDSHEKALHYSEKGIIACNKNRDLYGLAHLYLRKGVAKHFLNHLDYLKFLHLSIDILEASGYHNLAVKILEACKKNYGITL
ncbi:MAG: helix-turn-helix domain-containing protein [Alkaliphilus sp.]